MSSSRSSMASPRPKFATLSLQYCSSNQSTTLSCTSSFAFFCFLATPILYFFMASHPSFPLTWLVFQCNEHHRSFILISVKICSLGPTRVQDIGLVLHSFERRIQKQSPLDHAIARALVCPALCFTIQLFSHLPRGRDKQRWTVPSAAGALELTKFNRM